MSTIELPTPVQGKADWRSFRCLKLENGVTVCLVHDKESKTLAAATTVKAGAASDPRSMPGLAHFCEHMTFLGSEAYPGENEYKRFLSQHGGRSNAATSLHLTTYKFEVLAAHAEQALDIFSNFFVAPLFTKSGTGREVNAVDSENSKNLVSDVRRRLQILKDLCDQDHYFSKFTTGNSQTLPTEKEEDLDRIREALLAFHRKHYHPENLTVVVAGPQSLDELQSWVVPRFGSMTARNFPSDGAAGMTDMEKLVAESANHAPPFGFGVPQVPFQNPIREDLRDGTCRLLTVKPVQSMRRLVLMFPLPSVRKNPDRSPISVLSHLIGHEGPLSPFALLQNKGLITSLTAGNRFTEPAFSLFQVDMALTEQGEARWKECVDVILQYCRYLHEQAVASSKDGSNTSRLFQIWQEKIDLSRIFFETTSPGSVYSVCPSLCSSIVAYGTEASMSAGYMLKEDMSTFPLADFEHFTSCLVPNNCIVERASKAAWEEMENTSIKTNKENWYDVEYYLSELGESDVSRWLGESGTKPFLDASDRRLPDQNRYIPRTLELSPDLPEEAKAGPRIDKEIEPPNLILNDPVLGRLWHRLDDRYALPKSHLSFVLANAAVENTKVDGVWTHDPKRDVLATLTASMFNQALAQNTYDAHLSGLSWSLSLSAGGICLKSDGFSDRLNDLSLDVLKQFCRADPSFVTESYFSGAKDRLLRSLRTYFESRRADSHANYYRGLLLDASSESVETSLQAAESISLQDVTEYHQSVLHNEEVFLDCLICGNVSKLDSMSFFEEATTLLIDVRNGKPLAHPSMWVPGPTENRLAPLNNVDLHFSSENPHEENGALVMSYQSPIPGFRGKKLSTPESLRSTASLRLLSHVLKEPIFDELRTKQSLGYVVHSYFDGTVSWRPSNLNRLGAIAIPVDYFTIAILSRKVPPPELKLRVDDFLTTFRSILSAMPESEIKSHSTALSTKMLQPIQKLSAEASVHLARIRRYAPEICMSGHVSSEIPWENTKVLATEIQKLQRNDLLEAWDRTILADHRCRVSSMVYGSKFPLVGTPKQEYSVEYMSKTIINSTTEVFSLRKLFSPFDENPSKQRQTYKLLGLRLWLSNRSVAAIAAASVVGAGIIGWSLLRPKKRIV